VTASDPEVTSFDRKSPGSGCRRPTSLVLGMFELLQGCNSQEVAVTSQEMTARDRKCPGSDVISPEATGSGGEGGKHEFWVCLSSYSAVTRRRWQSRD